MQYIILDLEWDSAYSVKHRRFLNQILQIGAVRLNENFEVTDTFLETVKSSISKKVTGRFAGLTGITTEKMLAGVPFETAVDDYNAWAPDNAVTMTWSDSDLYSIKENEEYILNDKTFKIGRYLDLQRFVQGELRLSGYNDKNQISLSAAAEMLNVTYEGLELHTARDDSLLCAALLKRCYNRERFEPLIRNTADPEFYKRLRFKPYFISDINDERIDKKLLKFHCDKCGGSAKQLSNWRYRNRWFSAKFECENCRRRFCGRVTFKKTYDELKARRRICEIKPKTEKPTNDMQPVPERV